MSVDRRFRQGLDRNADVPEAPLDDVLTTIVRRAKRRRRVRRVAWAGAISFGLAAALVLGPRVLDVLRELGRVPTPAGPIPTSSPAPVILSNVPLGGVAIPPGTYRTRMHPKATFTLGPGWIGFVDKRAWLDLGFGTQERYAEFSVIRLTRVEAAGGPGAGSLVPAPDDLAAWIAHHPGLSVISPPRPVSVGGFPAEQVDVLGGSRNVHFGPIPGTSVPAGVCANCMERVISVVVRGRTVLVTWGSSPGLFRQTVGQLQSILATLSFT
jgi:hypothetical protein